MRWWTWLALWIVVALVALRLAWREEPRGTAIDVPAAVASDAVDVAPLVESREIETERVPEAAPVDEAEVEPAVRERPRRASRVPRDPLEHGDESLFLRCVDATTGEPVGGQVELWRLDVPEDDVWTAGSRLRRRLRVPEDGIRVTELPRGRYRAHVLSARRGSASPAAFFVPETDELILRVELPSMRRVELSFVDESGYALAGLEVGRAVVAYEKPFDPPVWAVVRTAKDPEAWSESQSAGGTFPLEAVLEGLAHDRVALRVPEPTVGEVQRGLHVRVRAPGVPWTFVTVDQALVAATGVSLVAPLLSDAALSPSFGRAAEGGRLHLASSAVLRDSSTAWLHAPVLVTTFGADEDGRSFEFTLAEGLPDF